MIQKLPRRDDGCDFLASLRTAKIPRVVYRQRKVPWRGAKGRESAGQRKMKEHPRSQRPLHLKRSDPSNMFGGNRSEVNCELGLSCCGCYTNIGTDDRRCCMHACQQVWKQLVLLRETRIGRFVKASIVQGRANRIASREEARARLCRRTLALFGATAYFSSTVRLAAGTMGCRTFDTGDFERTGWLDSRVMIDVMIDSLAFKKGSFGWGLELGASP